VECTALLGRIYFAGRVSLRGEFVAGMEKVRTLHIRRDAVIAAAVRSGLPALG
jgi:hypothetical protein